MSLLIAIVGNVKSQEGSAPVHAAEQAAQELGRQLAIAGHRIVVYSSDRFFLEPHVVSGFVSSQKAAPRSIQIRYAQGGKIEFPERQTHSLLFDLVPDSSSDWEISFYDSLNSVDGILLLGGGRSTLIAGLIGLGYNVAVLPIPVYGGYSQKVWNVLSSRKTTLKRDELALLARPDWTADDAASVIGLLKTHVERARESEEAQKREALKVSSELKRSALVAVLMFLAVAALVLISVIVEDLPVYVPAITIGVGAALAGISGATIRTLADLNENQGPRDFRPGYIRTCLGIVAGLLSALLIAVPQLTADPHLPEHVLKALTDAERLHIRSEKIASVVPLALLSSFVTAFLLDQFYRRLAELKVKEFKLPGA